MDWRVGVLAIGLAAFAHADGLGEVKIVESEYRAIRDAAMTIAQSSPPETHTIVSVGRSLNVIESFLRQSGMARTVGFPLSGFRHLPGGKAPEVVQMEQMLEAGDFRALKPAEEAKLFTQFDLLLRPDIEAGRKITFMDFSERGLSQYAVAEYFEAYLKNRGLKAELKTVIVASRDDVDTVTRYARGFGRDIELFELDPANPVTQNLKDSVYDYFAPYGPNYMQPDSSIGPHSPELHARAERALKEHIDRDQLVLLLNRSALVRAAARSGYARLQQIRAGCNRYRRVHAP